MSNAKVIQEKMVKTEYFMNLEPGDFFRVSTDLLIKTHVDAEGFNAMSLDGGRIRFKAEKTCIVPMIEIYVTEGGG